MIIKLEKLLNIFYYSCLTWLVVKSYSTSRKSEEEKFLIDKLLKNYNKNQKPPGTVSIKFALNLNQIVNVKSKEQIFKLNVFMDHEWIDRRISWSRYLLFVVVIIDLNLSLLTYFKEPHSNGNISLLRISSHNLWT